MLGMEQENLIVNTVLDEVLWNDVRSRKLRTTVIFEDGRPYLARFYVARRQTPEEPSVYLHYFFASDEQGTFHNHPWSWSRSRILTKGYAEERLRSDGTVERVCYLPGQTNTLSPDVFHRVDILGPGTWSLFMAGPRCDTWGFRKAGSTEVEDWKARNDRVKGDRSIESMLADDPRLERYRSEQFPILPISPSP